MFGEFALSRLVLHEKFRRHIDDIFGFYVDIEDAADSLDQFVQGYVVVVVLINLRKPLFKSVLLDGSAHLA